MEATPTPIKTGVIDGQKVVVNKQDMDWTEEESKRITDHLIGTQHQQDVRLITKETGVTRSIGAGEVEAKSTLFIKGCTDSTFTIEETTTKIMIEGCKNCTFNLTAQVKTEILEIWRCDDATVKISTPIKTLQADLSKNMTIFFNSEENFHNVVWGGVYDLSLTIGEGEGAHVLKTGYEQMKVEYPDLSNETDQFTVRIIEGKLLNEQVVRLHNGFPTTEREAREFDEKAKANEEAREKYMRDLIKFAAPKLSIKDDTKRPKVGRNEPCPCKSNKKFKACCWNKYSH